nr:NADH-plastoquinone oxidoreductase subunit 4L [Champereia manillana var. longistaminea]
MYFEYLLCFIRIYSYRLIARRNRMNSPICVIMNMCFQIRLTAVNMDFLTFSYFFLIGGD